MRIQRKEGNGFSCRTDFCAKRMGRNDRGVAALEFALLLPALLLIVVGIIEWGWVFFVDLSLTNAVREGARVGVTKTADQDPDPVQAAENTVDTYLAGVGLSADTKNVAMINGNTDLEVYAEIQVDSIINFLPDGLLPDTLKARAIMRWELAP